MKLVTQLILVLFLSQHMAAQVTEISPVPFLLFSNNYAFENPAAAAFYAPHDVRLVGGNYTGLLKNVGFYFLDTSTQTKHDSTSHTFGLVIHSEYETELLKRTRASVRYAWKTALSPRTSLCGAASMGFFNYFVKGTTSSAGSSVFSPLGAIGVWVNSDDFNIGLALNQVFGNSLQPINNTIKLGAYLSAVADYRVNISADYELLTALKTDITKSGTIFFQGQLVCVMLQNYTAGFVYQHLRGAGFSMGLKAFELNALKGDVSFAFLNHAFLTPNKKQNLGNNRIELAVRVFY